MVETVKDQAPVNQLHECGEDPIPPSNKDSSEALAADGAFAPRPPAAAGADKAPEPLAGVPGPWVPPDGVTVEKDKSGRITAMKYEGGGGTNFQYDAKGRMTSSETKDKDGKVTGTESVRYNDAAGTRVSVNIQYNDEGSVLFLNQVRDQFRDGKLVSHAERSFDSQKEMQFDDQGREYFSSEKDPNTGKLTEILRDFKEDGSVAVTSTSFDGNHMQTGRTTATFDKDGKQVGAEVSQRFDENENEVARVETTFIEGGTSRKIFENGELKRQVDVVKSVNANRAGHVTEKHLDAEGNLVKTIDVDYFPRQPYLPTKIVVTNPDGSVKESTAIEYATDAEGRLQTHGPTALIKSITHGEPPAAEATKEFANKRDQYNAWRDFWKSVKDVKTYAAPIGHPPNQGTYGPHLDRSMPRGWSAEDVKSGLNQSPA